MLLHLSIVRLLGIIGTIRLTSSSLVWSEMVSFTTIVVWTLVRVSVPAFAGLVFKVSAKCALRFAPEDALGDVVVIAIADPAACSQG